MNDSFKHFLLGVIVILAIVLYVRHDRKSSKSGAPSNGGTAKAGGKGGCGCGGHDTASHDGTTSPTAGNTGQNTTSDGSHYSVWGGTA